MPSPNAEVNMVSRVIKQSSNTEASWIKPVLQANNCWHWLSNQLEETYTSLRASQLTTIIILTVFLVSVFLVGSTGNILVLIVFAKNKTKQTATVFIMALATTDLTICLVVLPGVLIKEWYVPFRWDALCRGWELVRCATIPLSSLILVIVAVDRYIMICKVGHFQAISTKEARWILIGIIVCSVGLGIPPMLRVGVYQEGSSTGDPPEYLGLCISNDFLITKNAVDHYWQAMAAKFFLVLVTVIVLYSSIFHTVYQQGLWHPAASHSEAASVSRHDASKAPGETSNIATAPKQHLVTTDGPNLEQVTTDGPNKGQHKVITDGPALGHHKVMKNAPIPGNYNVVTDDPSSRHHKVDIRIPAQLSEGQSNNCTYSNRETKPSEEIMLNIPQVKNIDSQVSLYDAPTTLLVREAASQHQQIVPEPPHTKQLMHCNPWQPTVPLHKMSALQTDEDIGVYNQNTDILSACDYVQPNQLGSHSTRDRHNSYPQNFNDRHEQLATGHSYLNESGQNELIQHNESGQNELIQQIESGPNELNHHNESGQNELIQHNESGQNDLIQYNESKQIELIQHNESEQNGLIQHNKSGQNGLIQHNESGQNDLIQHNESETNPKYISSTKSYQQGKKLMHEMHKESMLPGGGQSHTSQTNTPCVGQSPTLHVGQFGDPQEGHSTMKCSSLFKRLFQTKVHPLQPANTSELQTPTTGKSSRTGAVKFQRYHITDARQKRIWTAQVKTAKVLLMVTIVYVLSFAPVLLMTVNAIPSHRIPFYTYFLHSAANPLIYSFINPTFRLQLMKLLKCRRWTE
ncbi:dopamine D2-like receptor [Biomphalaria pfeifferi]|uniref:Dopamine D2-like receptor n=1 Tax=Biomphalaria pfeifferi TaxID=112525 RepID=A0AAD8BRT1_BIOPF|nr:dopamine D2-like receptor [Biomphalaria pfeifferi]